MGYTHATKRACPLICEISDEPRFLAKGGCSALSSHHLPLGLPALCGAAAHREVHPALVRGHTVGMDHLHAVLPGAAARGIRACALAEHPARPAGADRCSGNRAARIARAANGPW